jgi:hypothetical protein
MHLCDIHTQDAYNIMQKMSKVNVHLVAPDA